MMAANHMEEGIDVTSGCRLVECIVVTPEETALQTPAQFVALPLFDGEIGIAPGRAPLIGRLGHGEMRIVEGKRLFATMSMEVLSRSVIIWLRF